jgi:hypothetical protein
MANEDKFAQPLETSYHTSLEDQSHHLFNSLSLGDWQSFSAKAACKGTGEPTSGELSFEDDIYSTKDTVPSLNNFENILNPIASSLKADVDVLWQIGTGVPTGENSAVAESASATNKLLRPWTPGVYG